MITLAMHFGAALAMALVLTPLCRLTANRLGLVAKPKEDRWHQRPTALFGGVAIALPTLLLGLAIQPFGDLWQLIACGAAIATFGFFDDFFSLKPSTKFVVQVAVASVLLSFGYRLQWTSSLLGDTMLTLFWVVGKIGRAHV